MRVKCFFHQSTFCGTINRFLALATENYLISGFLRGLIERNGTLALAIQCFLDPLSAFAPDSTVGGLYRGLRTSETGISPPSPGIPYLR
jgi:hypothetical protein